MSPSRPTIASEPVAFPAPPSNGVAPPIPNEVEAFCREHGITDQLKLSTQLAAGCFKSQDISCEVEDDYETDDRWVVVRVRTSGTVEEILAAHDKYTTAWVAAVRGPERFLIRLSSYIA